MPQGESKLNPNIMDLLSDKSIISIVTSERERDAPCGHHEM